MTTDEHGSSGKGEEATGVRRAGKTEMTVWKAIEDSEDEEKVPGETTTTTEKLMMQATENKKEETWKVKGGAILEINKQKLAQNSREKNFKNPAEETVEYQEYEIDKLNKKEEMSKTVIKNDLREAGERQNIYKKDVNLPKATLNKITYSDDEIRGRKRDVISMLRHRESEGVCANDAGISVKETPGYRKQKQIQEESEIRKTKKTVGSESGINLQQGTEEKQIICPILKVSRSNKMEKRKKNKENQEIEISLGLNFKISARDANETKNNTSFTIETEGFNKIYDGQEKQLSTNENGSVGVRSIVSVRKEKFAKEEDGKKKKDKDKAKEEDKEEAEEGKDTSKEEAKESESSVLKITENKVGSDSDDDDEKTMKWEKFSSVKLDTRMQYLAICCVMCCCCFVISILSVRLANEYMRRKAAQI